MDRFTFRQSLKYRCTCATIGCVFLLAVSIATQAQIAEQRSLVLTHKTLSDKDIVDQWFDVMEEDLTAAAQRAAAAKFRNRAEAAKTFHSLTPAAFRPRTESLDALAATVGGPKVFADRLVTAMKAEPAERDRRAQQMAKRVEPIFQAINANFNKQFPLVWQSDPTAALKKAKAAKRPAIVVFCAHWAADCPQIDTTISAVRLENILTDAFLAVRVDMTVNTAPATIKYQSAYHVSSVPLTLVFDRQGKEVARMLAIPQRSTLVNALESAAL